MEITTVEQIILIILALTLAIFLVLAITATVKLIQVLNHVKRVADKAEHLADKAEAVGTFFQRTASPFAMGKLLTHVAGNILKKSKSKK